MSLYVPVERGYSQRCSTLEYYMKVKRQNRAAYIAAGYGAYVLKCEFWDKCKWIYHIVKNSEPNPYYDWTFPRDHATADLIINNMSSLQKHALEKATVDLCQIGFDVLDRPHAYSEEVVRRLVSWGDSLDFLSFPPLDKGRRWIEIYQLFSYLYFEIGSIRPLKDEDYALSFERGPPYQWAIAVNTSPPPNPQTDQQPPVTPNKNVAEPGATKSRHRSKPNKSKTPSKQLKGCKLKKTRKRVPLHVYLGVPPEASRSRPVAEGCTTARRPTPHVSSFDAEVRELQVKRERTGGRLVRVTKNRLCDSDEWCYY